MHALAAILASEEGASHEIPYFIAGGLFALWAVVVSIGLRNPEFPGTSGAGRLTVTVSGVLAVATLGLLIIVTA